MGEKLSVQHQTGLSTTLSPLEKENLGSTQSSIVSQTDYVGNVIYEQGSAAKILFDGGYYSLVDNLCHYFTRDHLGSIRAMVNENGASFSTKISSLQNFHNVDVYGQSSYSFPSRYTNRRKPSLGMLWGRFDYPTYMVGGYKNDGRNAFLQGSPAPSMRKSRNGVGWTKSYYQIGKRY